jgi:pimeloyl-ACP methyl ester carboxylesterase
VLLHGVGESAVGWRPVQQALSRAYDVIALDFPGFGGSARLPANALPSAVALADAVEREMDQRGIGDFHVAGYSLGARVALELATRGRIRSVIAIAPDGLGTPPERVYQAMALMAGRTMATLLAPVATLMTASGPGRSLFFAMERSQPWKLTRQDARQLLLNFASAPAYEETVLATMFDIPTGLDRITCPVLIMQGTADPLISMQSPRFLTFIPHAQFRWLYGLSHVPISDDPELVTRLMLDFLTTTAEERVPRESLPAPARRPARPGDVTNTKPRLAAEGLATEPQPGRPAVTGCKTKVWTYDPGGVVAGDRAETSIAGLMLTAGTAIFWPRCSLSGATEKARQRQQGWTGAAVGRACAIGCRRRGRRRRRWRELSAGDDSYGLQGGVGRVG